MQALPFLKARYEIDRIDQLTGLSSLQFCIIIYNNQGQYCSMENRSSSHVMISSFLASIITALLTNPIQVLKLKRQVSLGCNEIGDCMVCLPKNKSMVMPLRSYFNGLSLNCKSIAFSNMMFLGLYERILEQFKSMNMTGSIFFASIVSRACVSICNIPLQNLRIRKSLKSSKEVPFYTGALITLARDTTFSGIYWPLIQYFRTYIKGQNYRQTLKSRQDLLIDNLISGIVVGAFCSLITTPLDILKTRIQSGVSESLVESLKIMMEKGIPGMMTGWSLRLGKGALHCSSMLVFYEGILSSTSDYF